MVRLVQFKTKSEELIAAYLDEANYCWDYEPEIVGHLKRPDFRVRQGVMEVLCDVKERSPTEMPTGPRFIDPIAGVRKLIEKGREKFKSFGQSVCALCVCNNGDHDTRLDPCFIYGAMLGNPGFQFGFSPESGTIVEDSCRSIFLPQGGKMIRHYAPLELHDSVRHISAIIALDTYRIPNPRYDQAFNEEIERRRARLGRGLTNEERISIRFELMCQMRATLGEAPRVVVWTNPFALHHFPNNLFMRGHDERWSIESGTMKRVFAGASCPPLQDDD